MNKIVIYMLATFSTLVSVEQSLAKELFDIAVGTSMQKIRNDGSDLNKLQFNGRINIDLAGDESESFQLVVIPNKQVLPGVKVTIEPLKGPGQNLKIEWHLVGYVRTGNTSYQVEYVGWWPDPLLPAADFNVPADRVQPLWFTVTAPPNTKSGVYRCSVVIEASNYQKEIPLTVRVRNFTLPRPGKLAAPFGVYMHTVAEWYYGEGKKLKIEDFEKWCKFLTDYRLTPKNIGDEYVKQTYKTLPDGKKVLDTVDMNDLKKTVGELSARLSPYAYGLYRLPIARLIPKALKEKDSTFTPETITASVVKHYEEWKRQGLPDNVYIYGMDEPQPDEGVFEFVCKTYSLIKKAIPSCKIMQTGTCDKPELVGLVDIWCPKTEQVEIPFFAERLAAGDTLWAYVCPSPIAPYANFFIDRPAIEPRVMFWQTKQIGATGFLLWSTTWWKGLEPMAASGKPCFPDVPLDMRYSREYRVQWVHVNGDGLLIYPGKDVTPLPSIRLEVIRDGIEDYEYLSLLEELTAKVKELPIYKTPEGATLIREAEQLCKVPVSISKGFGIFTQDPHDIIDQRKEIGDMIEQLVNVLEEKDYKVWWNITDNYFKIIE